MIPNLTSELRNVQREQQDVGQTFERERAMLDTLLSRREELIRQRRELMTRYSSNDEELTVRTRELRDLESFLSSARAELNRRQDSRDALEREISSVVRSLTDKRRPLSPAKTREDQAEGAYDAFYTARISPIETEVSVEFSQKRSLEGQVAELQALDRNLLALAKRIADSRAAVEVFVARMLVLDAELARMEPIVRSLKAAWEALGVELKAVTDRKEGILAEANRLQLDLQALEANQDKIVKELK